MGRVDERVAIVTGAARGMGAEHARLLASEGAKVVLTDVRTDRGEETVREIESGGGEARFVEHDVQEEPAWERVVDRALDAFGTVDVLVNNAGISGREQIAETTMEDWQRVIAVNQTGVFLGMKHVIPVMQKSGGGSIINISSVNGIQGLEFASAYQASKGAVRMLTKTAAVQYGADNIRANSIHPGLIDTELVSDLFELDEDDPMMRWMHEKTLLDRFGRPEDVSYAVLYLASDESRWVTGGEFVIDGGYTAH